jgi:hypothetical protein
MHKTLAEVPILCNNASVKRRADDRERPLRGQRRLKLGVPALHSVQQEHRRCGKPNCRTCRDGAGHGPYLYAVWREGTKVKRKYLGRA